MCNVENCCGKTEDGYLHMNILQKCETQTQTHRSVCPCFQGSQSSLSQNSHIPHCFRSLSAFPSPWATRKVSFGKCPKLKLSRRPSSTSWEVALLCGGNSHAIVCHAVIFSPFPYLTRTWPFLSFLDSVVDYCCYKSCCIGGTSLAVKWDCPTWWAASSLFLNHAWRMGVQDPW